MIRPRFAAVFTLALAIPAVWAPATFAADPPEAPPVRSLYASP
ncbi:MAG: hypothetical protein JWM80_4891, partial [Cyanobacteria bacterium RYN_339]|nr:hypothetical protein [Cyanobacteria bacterium RYN_339]